MDCATYIMCEGILIEILRRLPAKSLIRFMAVCRLWKTIITSPQFMLHPKRPSKLFVHTVRGLYTLVEDGEEEKRLMLETDFPLKNHARATVIGSDNGLVCICMFKLAGSGQDLFFGHHSVIIWNPCVRKHVVVPDVVDDETHYLTEYASGFGGTASGDDYKYVRLVGFCFDHGDEGSLITAVYIYSLKSGTWRRKNLDPGMQGCDDTCALLRGRLHWIGGVGNEIYSFELEDEVFGNNITLPESIQSIVENYVSVIIIRESLAAIASDQEQGLPQHSRTVCVWVMEEYGDVNSWNKLWNIVVEGFYYVERNMVHLMKDGELLLGLGGIGIEKKLVTCNPKTMETCDFGPSLFPEAMGFSYKESLVLLGDHYHAAAADPFS